MQRSVAALGAGIVVAGFGIHGFAALAHAAPQLSPLVSPAELAAFKRGADPLLLDIRQGEASEGVSVYEAGHVPGAVHAPYARWRGPAANPGEVLSDAALTDFFRSLGVEEGRPVVVIHQGDSISDFGAAARVYWTLKSAGIDNLAILNGGVEAWTAEELALATDSPAPQPSEITVSLGEAWIATRDDIRAIVDGEESATLIDARPEAFYNGETAHGAAARPGTLPQARLFTHANWFGSGPAVIEQETVRRLVAENSLDNGEALVSFCNTGHWAATNWFALSELGGIENVKLYPESVVAWSQAGLPMDNVPGRLQHLWMSVKSWF
ncbi:sulfurtransferase [Saliniramus sp.]|uniref:sulfurtransferase n=1 Tax=Saliniramus sp. TaxID=2986772 RepID=UPI002CA82292|nr:rhodanese-like domain-containing protein [Saliniramus sp.]HMB11434.1 rhodanese-like domain-containing protein [Saliniramus sp.]